MKILTKFQFDRSKGLKFIAIWIFLPHKCGSWRPSAPFLDFGGHLKSIEPRRHFVPWLLTVTTMPDALRRPPTCRSADTNSVAVSRLPTQTHLLTYWLTHSRNLPVNCRVRFHCVANKNEKISAGDRQEASWGQDKGKGGEAEGRGVIKGGSGEGRGESLRHSPWG
jgi:hypothetical protein